MTLEWVSQPCLPTCAREAADSGCSCARLSQREGQAEGDLGDVGAGQVEGHPHAVAEESQDEILDEAVRLGAASDALYDAGREAGYEDGGDDFGDFDMDI